MENHAVRVSKQPVFLVLQETEQGASHPPEFMPKVVDQDHQADPGSPPESSHEQMETVRRR